jgi:DNA-binding Xre family transcriptional regulator
MSYLLRYYHLTFRKGACEMPKKRSYTNLPGFDVVISKRGFTRRFLAKQLGLRYKVLWGIVSGTMKRIDPNILRSMAETLGCTTDELLYPPPSDDGGTRAA